MVTTISPLEVKEITKTGGGGIPTLIRHIGTSSLKRENALKYSMIEVSTVSVTHERLETCQLTH
jgi:hypothetical protein